jgi:hypothetical protein
MPNSTLLQLCCSSVAAVVQQLRRRISGIYAQLNRACNSCNRAATELQQLYQAHVVSTSRLSGAAQASASISIDIGSQALQAYR